MRTKDFHMNQCFECTSDLSKDKFQEDVCSVDLGSACETLQQLQARIFHLENELKKQRVAAEKGAKYMKVIYGDKFENESLF